jgi:hypothetical protein
MINIKMNKSEYSKLYWEQNKNELMKKHKLYWEKNKNELMKKNKERRIKNRKPRTLISDREKRREYEREYRKSENGIKCRRINQWKGRGVLEYGYTYSELYEYYNDCNNCEVCGKDITDKHQKCLDHCHETGCFRWVLCKECNTFDNWINYCPS